MGATEDRRTAVEMQLVQQSMQETGTAVRWVSHARMVVDCLRACVLFPSARPFGLWDPWWSTEIVGRLTTHASLDHCGMLLQRRITLVQTQDPARADRLSNRDFCARQTNSFIKHQKIRHSVQAEKHTTFQRAASCSLPVTSRPRPRGNRCTFPNGA